MQYGLAHWFTYKFLTRSACLTMVPDDPAKKDEFTDLNATQFIRDAVSDDEHVPDVGAIMGGGAADEEDFSDELAQLAAMVDNMPAPSASPPPHDDLAGLEEIAAPDFSATQVATPAAPAPAPSSNLPEVPDAIVEEIGKISLMQRILGLFRIFSRRKNNEESGLDTLPSVDSIASLDEGEEYHPPWYLRKGIVIGLGLLALLILAGLSFFLVSLLLGGSEHKTPPAAGKEAAAHAAASDKHAEAPKHAEDHAAAPASGTAAAASGTSALQQQYEALLKKNQQLEEENKQLKQVETAKSPASTGSATAGNSGVIGGGDQKGMECQLVGGNAENSLKKCIEQFNQQDAARK